MNLHRCVVRHRGDLTMTIHKEGVTAGEILLLRQIHGDDAVLGIEVMKKKSEITPREEMARLAEIYGPTLVAQAWPGVSPRLPETLREAGLAEEKDPEAEMQRIVAQTDPALVAAAEALRGDAASDLT